MRPCLRPPCLQSFNTEVTEMLRALRVEGLMVAEYTENSCRTARRWRTYPRTQRREGQEPLPLRFAIGQPQKYNFRAIWTSRGVLTWLCTFPKPPALKVVSTLPNCGWLRALKASTRNSSREPSRILFKGISLNKERAALLVPGRRTLGIMRGALPMVQSAGTESTSEALAK